MQYTCITAFVSGYFRHIKVKLYWVVKERYEALRSLSLLTDPQGAERSHQQFLTNG